MKKLMLSIIAITMCLSLCGCSNEVLEQERIELQNEIETLKTEKSELENVIAKEKEDKNVAKYVVTINIKQVHYNFDIGDMLKDSMNDVSIQIPVDKEYYDSLKIGDVIDDSFRMGSLVMKGSFGKWKITVENKEIK